MNRLFSPGARKSNLKKIEPVSTKGTQPLSRVKSSSAVTDDGEFFLFGGFDEDDNCKFDLNDILILLLIIFI